MDFRPFDADNHHYEPLEAFTRHLEPEFSWRGVRPVRDGKHVQILVGGKLCRFVPNPTFDPIVVPGVSISPSARSGSGTAGAKCRA